MPPDTSPIDDPGPEMSSVSDQDGERPRGVETQSFDHLRHYSDPDEIGVTTSDSGGVW